jgi:RNA recognition motif-containing protein
LTKTFDSNLFVKNIPSSVTEEEFKTLFETFGKDTKTQNIPCNFVSGCAQVEHLLAYS